jgi:Tfp pilus assembly protein PilN
MKAVNLLPSDQRSAAKASPAAKQAKVSSGDGFAGYVVLGALAMAVVAFAALTLTKNQISDRTADLSRTQAETQAVANEAASLKPYADFKQLAEARVQTVSALATTRFDWEQTLRDLSHALPREVRLSGLKGQVRGTSAAATDIASPTIDLAGCTRSQTSVARLMARLRAVRGVSRVALRSSAKAATATGVVTAGEGGSLCAKSNAPTFALTIYFERFGVPAVSAPAAAAPAGAATVPGAAAGPTGAAGAATTTTTPATPGPSGTTPGTGPATSATTPSTQGVSAP